VFRLKISALLPIPSARLNLKSMRKGLSPLFYDKLGKIIEKRKELLLRLAEKDFVNLTVDEVVEINHVIMLEHKGVFGVRDYNLIDSSLSAVMNKYLHEGEKDLYSLGSVLFTELIRTRPFMDGNKRTAVVALELFLEQNGVSLTTTNDALYRLALGVAKGEIDEEEVIKFLKGERGQKKISRRFLSP